MESNFNWNQIYKNFNWNQILIRILEFGAARHQLLGGHSLVNNQMNYGLYIRITSSMESGLVQDAERGPPPNRKEHLFQQCRENVFKLCRENRQLRKEIQLIQMYVRHVLECAPIPQNRRPQWVR